MTGHPTESLPQSNVPSEEGLIASSALLQNSNSGFLFLSRRPHFFNCLSIYSFVSFFSSSHLLPHFIISLVTLSPRSYIFFSPIFGIISGIFLSHPPQFPSPPFLYPSHLSPVNQEMVESLSLFLLITQPFTLITLPSRDVSVREQKHLCKHQISLVVM